MRTTVDIPDTLYRELKTMAAVEKRSVKDLILRGVKVVLSPAPVKQTKECGKWILPNLKSKNPGSLKLGPEGVYEYIPFP